MACARDDLRRQLAQARLYVCTDARASRGDLVDFLDAITSGGPGIGADVVQLRDKSLGRDALLPVLDIVRERCDAHGVLWCVNDDPHLAVDAGAPMLHVGQDDAPPAMAREIVGSQVLIGQSTHNAADLSAALADGDVDYFAVGPLWATPTKPGRPAAGLGYLAAAVAAAGEPDSKPWFAIGGIDQTNVREVIGRGARRVVVVRAVTDAADPRGAVRSLRASMAG